MQICRTFSPVRTRSVDGDLEEEGSIHEARVGAGRSSPLRRISRLRMPERKPTCEGRSGARSSRMRRRPSNLPCATRSSCSC